MTLKSGAHKDSAAAAEAWRDALLAPLWESSAHTVDAVARAGHHWRWDDINRCALQAAALTDPAAVERRVLRFVNPDPAGPNDESTVGNLAAAVQILLPGESARPHRHSINALRFILVGESATTIVNGTAVPMRPGDMLLTPGDCWHEHRHDGDDTMIWFDIVDAPLNDRLGVTTFEPGPVRNVPATVPGDAFRSPNIIPADVEHHDAYSPVFAYPFEDAMRALSSAPASANGARAVRYVNPLTGGAALSSIEIRLLGLDANQSTIEHQSNASTICLIVDGEGESRVGDRHFSWSKYDVISIPQHAWYRHKAHTQAQMFVVCDAEALRRLSLYRERFAEPGAR